MIYGADGSCTFDKKAKSEIHSAKQRAEYFAKFGAHKFRSIGGTSMSGLPCMSGAAL